MTSAGSASVEFVRLTEVPLAEVMALVNDTRTHRHLPLAGSFSEEATAAWVRSKDGQWEAHGYGPWAVLVDGRFAGWGGFQREEGGADFGLVLHPEYWGQGSAITRLALARAFGELGLEEVTIALPYTRRPGPALARFGFRPDGTVTHAGTPFQQFRLTRTDWQGATGGASEHCT